MTRKAFTLVELLVVIAIIALLISILAPSLKLAKVLAKNTICMTHLRAVGSAAGLYAGVNQERLPPHRGGYGDVIPRELAVSYGLTAGNPILDSDGNPVLVGMWSYLHKYGLVPADMIYCPSKVLSTQYMRSTYADPYGTVKPDPFKVWSGVYMSCGYMFNTPLTQVSTGPAYGFQYTRLGEFATDKVLSMDIFIRWWDCSHGLETWGYSRDDPPTWMLVYPDGHVTSRRSMKAWLYIIDTDGWFDRPDLYVKGLDLLLGS